MSDYVMPEQGEILAGEKGLEGRGADNPIIIKGGGVRIAKEESQSLETRSEETQSLDAESEATFVAGRNRHVSCDTGRCCSKNLPADIVGMKVVITGFNQGGGFDKRTFTFTNYAEYSVEVTFFT